MPVTGCRGGVRMWRLHCHGKGARFNNFTAGKLRTLLLYAFAYSLPHSKRGFGMGLQQQTHQQCKQKCTVRRKEKEECSLLAIWVNVVGTTGLEIWLQASWQAGPNGMCG